MMAIITISRGTFAGGQVLAECVAKRLGYRCLSREVLVEATKDHGVPMEELIKALSEPAAGLFRRKSLNRLHCLIYIWEALLKEVSDEKTVYHGMAGQLLLRGVPHVLRVFIVGNMESRIQAAIERLHYNSDQAAEFIKNNDRKRDKWVKFLYKVNRRDASLYDLTINLDRISMSSACEIICTAVNRPEYQPTPESQKALRDMVLAADIRSEIASRAGIDDDYVRVEADDGVILLKGIVQSIADADKVREVVRQLPNIKDIRSEMRVRA